MTIYIANIYSCVNSHDHLFTIGHVLNEQGTGHKYLKSIELKNGSRHLKEHPNISKLTKFESDWLKRKRMVHFSKSLKLESFVWIGGTPVPPIHTKLSNFSKFEKCTMHF